MKVRSRRELEAADPSGRRALSLDLFERALDAVDPRAATSAALRRLIADGEQIEGAVVIAFGKAARAMAQGALDVCMPREGIVVDGVGADVGPLVGMKSSHPVPTERSLAAGRAVLDVAGRVKPDDVILCLVSGGASAMVELPAPGVRLEDVGETTARLLAAGAPIEELNAVRRSLSRIKGGRLAEAAAPARLLNVILSDVPGAGLEVVASGPTLPPPVHVEPMEVIRRRRVEAHLPAAVRRALSAPAPAPDGRAFERVRTELAADNLTARHAMVAAAEARGLRVAHLEGFAAGEARETGARFYADALGSGAEVVVWGGETTVDVRGDGRGGRNLELVLGAFERFAGGLLLSAGTDGVDGASDAAGALLDEHVVARARAAGVDAAEHLARNDADRFFERAGGRIVTGPTGTNVADVCVYVS